MPPRRGDWAILVVALLLLVAPVVADRFASGGLERFGEPVRPLEIHVSTAPWYEWALLEGIGESRARRVEGWIRARVRESGPIASLDDLREIPGMPEGWVELARPYLRLEVPGGGPRPEDIPR